MFKNFLKRYILSIGIAQTVTNLLSLIATYGPQDNSVVNGFKTGLKIHHTNQALRFGLDVDEFEVYKTIHDLHNEN